MKLGELKGKPVVTVAEARKVGVVDDLLVDVSSRKIEALRVAAEGRGPQYVVSTEDVRAIGPDAVTITSLNALQIEDRARDLASLPSLTSLLHRRVVTEGGELLGTISEIHFDPVSGQLQAFEYNGGALGSLLGRHHRLDPSNIVGIGPNIVTVRETERPSQAA